jgi:hypothetical protein
MVIKKKASDCGVIRTIVWRWKVRYFPGNLPPHPTLHCSCTNFVLTLNSVKHKNHTRVNYKYLYITSPSWLTHPSCYRQVPIALHHSNGKHRSSRMPRFHLGHPSVTVVHGLRTFSGDFAERYHENEQCTEARKNKTGNVV